MKNIIFVISLIFSLCLLGGCQTHPQQTLYQKLGGQAGIENLVASFIQQIGQDQQIFHYFEHANINHFRNGFVSHLCAISDGPCEYSGDSMVDIHTGMNVNEADFNHVVDLLVKAMEQNDLPLTTQNEVLSRLAPLRPGVIYL
ncbi:group I truncated hemoglobin [Neptunicella sp. SCSIO 80796]|uniref:group I truncated hemoglobin n=1 Tax=Neptunicella plasticusilytica TaxID=3117012 RepID=UPI003A4D730E